MNRGKKTQYLEDIVRSLVRKWEKEKKERGKDVFAAWNVAVGEKAAARAMPVSFKKGVLMVIVENSTWLYNLTMEKRMIIKKFNENYTGRAKVSEVRFRVGKIER